MKDFTSIKGWLPAKEGRLLQRYAQEQQEKFNYDLLEVGSWKGRSSVAIASVLKDDHRLWMVDHFHGGPETTPPKKPLYTCKYHRHRGPWAYPETLENIMASQVQDKVIIVPLSSQQAARAIEEMFCFIFIDGDHTYDGISSDWALWFPHLVPGGICLFHDARHGSIKKLLDELREWPILKEEKSIGATTAFRRLE